MPKENLYFIAIIPPTDICSEITIFKNDFAENYNSSKALKVMPHITLKVPFKISEEAHGFVTEWFESLQMEIASFDIELKDFGRFPNKKRPVIFVNPIVTLPLFSLQKELIRKFQFSFPDIAVSAIERSFHPHMTVAYRDLSPEEFVKAWVVYKEKKYSAHFKAESFHLLQHDSLRWNVIATNFLR